MYGCSEAGGVNPRAPDTAHGGHRVEDGMRCDFGEESIQDCERSAQRPLTLDPTEAAGTGPVSGKLKGCEPATRCSTQTRSQRVLPCAAFTRRSPRRASHPGSRSGCTRATCATAGTSPRSPSKAGLHRGTMTLTGFALRAPRIFSSGPPKSSQGHADNGSEPGGGFLGPAPNSGRWTTADRAPAFQARRAWGAHNGVGALRATGAELPTAG